MKKLIFILSAIALFYSCNLKKNEKDKQGGKKVVTVSIVPEKTFVEKIAGNDFEVNVLVPPGASPATYTLSPSQLINIVNSSIWFRIGHIGFEYSWKDKIGQANKNMKVVDLSEGLGLIDGGHGHHGGHADKADPHIWLSPVMVKEMAGRIVDELSALNPGKRERYMANYQEFMKKTDLLDIQIKNMLKNYQGRKIFIFHPSLSYYAKYYGLEQCSLELEGKEPTPQHLKEMVDLAEKGNIKVIYIQSEFDRGHANVFAGEIGGEVVTIDPLAPAWSDNLLRITQTFIDNF